MEGGMSPTLDKYFNIFRQKLFEAVLLDMPQNTLLTYPPLITEFLFTSFIEDLIAQEYNYYAIFLYN